MRPITNVYTITGDDTDGIVESVTPLAGGALTFDGVLVSGGVLTLPTAQHISVSCAGADAARSFVVAGTDFMGQALTETLAGSSGSITIGTSNFKTVTSVTVDDATAGAITVGVSETCETPWIPLDHHKNPFQFSYSVDIGAATFAVEGCLEDVQDSSVTKDPFDVKASGTSDVADNSTKIMSAVRVKVTSWTSGTVQFTVQQAG